jgi:hypothetical protein
LVVVIKTTPNNTIEINGFMFVIDMYKIKINNFYVKKEDE